MYYSNFFLTILIFLSIQTAWAGGYEFSQEQRLSSKINKFRIIGRNNDGIVVRMFGRDDVLDLYNTSMQRIASKKIELNRQSGNLQHVMLNKTGLQLFYLTSEKRQTALWAQKVNSRFMDSGQPVLLDTLPDTWELVESNLRFKTSLNQSKLLAYYPVFNNKGVQYLWLFCLNDDMAVLWKQKIVLQRPERDLERMRVLLSNNGEASIVFFSEPNDKENGSLFSVYHVNQSGASNQFTYQTEQPIFGEPYVDLDQNKNSLVVSYLFDEKEERRNENASNGYVYLVLNPENGNLIQNRIIPYPKDFMKNLTAKADDKLPEKLFTFTVKKAITRKDGGVLLMAESFLKDSREAMIPSFQPGMNSFRTVNTYQFNDVIIFSIDSNGNTEWHEVLRKKQISEDDDGYYSSFYSMNRISDLLLLFLDDPGSKSSFSSFQIKPNGETDKKTIFDQNDWDVHLVLRYAKQTAINELVIPSLKGDAFKLVRVEF